jgi:CRISPR-associated exonuclease Cas4
MLDHDRSSTRGSMSLRGLYVFTHDDAYGRAPARGLLVWHDELGLTGVCDVVELHRDGTVVPVEHKSGRYLAGGPADLQVAAQAICLEAMFSVEIPAGVIYSAADRRRHDVAVDDTLRAFVAETTAAVRAMTTGAALPPAPADRRCRRCSLAEACMPGVLAGTRRYRAALDALFTPGPAAGPPDEPRTPRKGRG